MTDFKIRRGLSTDLFINGDNKAGVIEGVVLENGCWYLCTDTADLFLCVQQTNGLTLKRINEKAGWDITIDGDTIDASVIIALRAEVDNIKESLNSYAKTSDIPSLEGYATKEFVVDAIDKHEALATIEEVKTKLETEVLPTVQETILPTVQKVETEILPTVQELAEKAATQEWVQEQSFATETFVEEKISEIEIPEVPAKISELENDAGYITLAEVPKVDLSVKADKVHYHDEYAQKEHNHDDLYEAKGAAEAVKNELLNGAGDAFDTLKELGDLINTNKDALSTLESVAAGKADKVHSHAEYLTEHQSLEGYAKAADLKDFATESFVNEAITKIELTPGKDGADGQDGKNGITPHIGANGNWFLGDDDTGVKAHGIDGTNGKDGQDGAPGEKGETGEQGPAGKDGKDGENGKDGKDFTFDMFTTEQLESLKVKGDPGQDGKDGKDGLTTSVKIGETTYDHENGIIALPEFSAKIPFTTAKLVNNPIGTFKMGDDLVGMSITEILTKLLGLSDSTIVDPDEPGTPTEPNSIVEKIIANKIPMYSVNLNGEVAEVAYDEVITYTEDAAKAQPKKSGFYQIIDEAGEVVESGYQELTADNPNVIYIIALPKDVDFSTMVMTQTYDTLESKWKNDSLEMSNDYNTISGICEALSIDISHIDLEKYTLWADLTSGQGPSGKIHRFIINE
jgi:hypothetical protein